MSVYQKLHQLFFFNGLNSRWEPVSGLGWEDFRPLSLSPVPPRSRRFREQEIAENINRPKKLRRLLAALPDTLSVSQARLCCYHALFQPSHVLAMVLGRCPPASRLFYTGAGADLVYFAAALGRRKHLELLLEYGADPAQHKNGFPPLAAAAICGQDHCVRVLLEALPPDQLLTPELMDVWSLLGTGSHSLDHCIRLIARRLPRLCGDDRFPIPPGMTLLHGVRSRNLPLFELLCREAHPTHQETMACLPSLDETSPQLPRVLELLLTADSALLRQPQLRGLLVLAALAPDRGIPEEVAPWVSRLHGSIRLYNALCSTSIFYILLSHHELTVGEILDRWADRLPPDLRPTLDRRVGLCAKPYPDEEDFDRLLSTCRLVGPAPKGEVGPLARSVLALASPQRMVQELAPGGLLDHDPLQLIQLCQEFEQDPDPFPESLGFFYFLKTLPIRRCRTKRQLLTAMSRQSAPDYDL